MSTSNRQASRRSNHLQRPQPARLHHHDLDTGDDAQLCIIILEAGNDNVANGLTVPSNAANDVSIMVWRIAFSGFSNAAVNLQGGSGSLEQASDI